LGATYVPESPIVSQELTVTLDVVDPDNDPLTYTYLVNDENSQSSSSNVIKITPTASGWLKMIVTVKDDSNAADSTTQWIYVRSNAKPQIRKITGVIDNWDKSSGMTIQVDAFDPDGDRLVYTVELYDIQGARKTVWGTVNSTTGAIVINKDQIANDDYALKIKVADAQNYVLATKWFRADNNKAPTISKVYNTTDASTDISDGVISLQSGVQVLIKVDASDDVDTPTFEWIMPEEFTVTGADTDTVTLTPIEGVFSAAIIVYDSAGLIDSKRFDIDVQQNRPPVIDYDQTKWTTAAVIKDTSSFKTASGTILNNDELALSVVAEDPDGNGTLAYCFGNIVGDSIVAPTLISGNVATYKLTDLSTGFYSVKYQVVVSGEGTCDQINPEQQGDKNSVGYASFEISEDRKPYLTQLYVPRYITIGSNDSMFAVAEDPEGEPLSFEWDASHDSGDPASKGTITPVTSDDTSSEVNYAPTIAGNVTITLKVSDGSVFSDTITRKIVVRANQDPKIFFMDVFPTSLNIGGTLFLSASAYDNDDVLTSTVWKIKKQNSADSTADLYTQLDSGPDGITVPALSGEVSLPDLPTYIDTPGDYDVWLEVTGGGKTLSYEENKVKVTFTQANTAPSTPELTFNPANKTTLAPGEPVEIIANSTDPDGEPVSFEWKVDGFVLNTNTSTLTFSEDIPGEYKVNVYAFDGDKYSDMSADVTFTIQSLTMDVTADTSVMQVSGTPFIFSATMSNGAEVPANATWTVLSSPEASTATITETGPNVSFTPIKAGNYEIMLTAEVYGEYYDGTVSITVIEAPPVEGYESVTGTIRDNYGELLAGVQVRLYHKTNPGFYDQTTTTNSEGYYEFAEVPPGTYYLVAYAGNGYILQTHAVTME